MNLISIRFMELIIIKRRYIVVLGEMRLSLMVDGKEDLFLEKCVVVGVCMVFILELY